VNVSIIICTRNRAQSLRPTLSSLAEISFPCDLAVELLVVDNGSTDQTREIAQSAEFLSAGVRYVFESNPGLVNARHAGIKAAQGPVIVFLDDDTRPDSGWLERLTEPLITDRADCASGGIRVAPHLRRPWMSKMHHGYLASTEGREEIIREELIGANMAFHRRVLAKVPRFDPELGAGALGFGEDTLFSHQLIKAGFRLAAVPSAVMEHHFDITRLTRRSFLARAKGQGRARAYLAYHWHHVQPAFEYLEAAKRGLRLVLNRVRRRTAWPHRDGAPEWELAALENYHYRLYLAQLAGTPRKYERHGLVKL
jgi:glycosyltransferase involved in cell wall biosynthesis